MEFRLRRNRDPWSILELFSLAMAAGIGSEAAVSGNWGVEQGFGLLVALLFAAVPRFGGFRVPCGAFCALCAAKYFYFRPFSASRHDLLPFLLALILPFLAGDRAKPADDSAIATAIYATLGALFFEAAVYKLANFADWSDGGLLYELITYRRLYNGGAQLPPSGGLTAWWAAPLSWLTLLFEAGFLSGLRWRKLRLPFLAGAVIFQGSIYVVLGVNFLFYQLGILAVLLSVEAKLAGFRAWPARRHAPGGS